jgi:hypothetical protein
MLSKSRAHHYGVAAVIGLLSTLMVSTVGSAQESQPADLAKACESKSGTWLERYRECEHVDQPWCTAAGGRFEECGSACRHNPDPAAPCTLQCVAVCSFPVKTEPEMQSSAPAPAPETNPAPVKSKKAKKEHRGAIIVAPLPIVSPAVGYGIIPVAGYIFPFSKNDKESPPSTVGAGGLITNNGSRAYFFGGDLYLKHDTYEVTAMFGDGNVNYDLYGSGAFEGLKLPLIQTGHLFRGEVLRRLWWKVFVGPRFWSGKSSVTLAPNSDTNLPPLPSGFALDSTMRALGIRIIRDTRPNQFFPTAGEKLEFTGDFFMQSLGSKYSFQAYRLTFNQYHSLSKNQVLAYDMFACVTSGQPPFYGNCIYGTSNELRGYAAAKYIDRYMFTTQLEYRLTLPKGIGLAGFAGVGEVIPGSSQVLFKNNHFLPDVGAGPRYELSRKFHVNLRADFARGRDSWT